MTRLQNLREATKAVEEIFHDRGGKAIRLRHIKQGGREWDEVIFSSSSGVLRHFSFWDDGTVYGGVLDYDVKQSCKYR